MEPQLCSRNNNPLQHTMTGKYNKPSNFLSNTIHLNSSSLKPPGLTNISTINTKDSDIIFWNIAGLNNKINNSLIKKLKEFHIFGLAETWAINNTLQLAFPNYNIIFSPAIKPTKVGRPRGGLILAIKKYFKTITLSQTSDWIIIKVIKPESFYLAICYISPNTIHDNLLQQFFQHVKPLTETSLPCLILGDFNARIGCSNNNSHLPLRQTADKIINTRGRSLDKFLNENSLTVLNGRTPSDSNGSLTFLNSQGGSLIDLALTINIELETLDLTVLNLPDSDHFPIHLHINRDTHDFITPESSNNHHAQHKRLRWQTETKDTFLEALTLPKTDNQNINETQIQLKNEIIKAAEKAGMYKSYGREISLDRPWFDLQCRGARELSIIRLKEFRHKSNDNSRSIYLSAKNYYKKLIQTKKDQYFLALNNRILNSKSPAEFWGTIRQFHNKKTKIENIPIQLMYEHYKHTFSTNTIILPMANNPGILVEDATLDDPITVTEVINTIKTLKNKKSPGSDLIPNEFLKYLPVTFLQVLTTLFNNILKYHEFPHDWCASVIQPIHKSGPANNPSNYRPISLLSTMLKLFTSILNSRLQSWCYLKNAIPEEQAGFRSNYGCMDHIFALNTMIQLKLRFKRRKLYTFFVDLKQAFDSVNHSLLINKLISLGLSSKFTKTINALYSSAHARVKDANNLTEPFPILNGVLQGEILSPTLFSLFMADYPDILNNSNIPGITVGSKEIHSLLYADDIVIVADSIINLQKKINLTKKYFEQNLLTINLTKSKIMIFQNGGRNSKKEKWFWGNQPIEIVKTYKYLGVHFSSSGSFTHHCNKAINKSLLATNSMWPILTKANIKSMKTRFNLFDSLVKSVLIYSSPIWAPGHEDSIERVQSNFIKKTLHLNPMTPSYILRLETGRRPLSLNIFKNTIRFWFRCLTQSDNRITRQCYLTLTKIKSDKLKDNWTYNLQKILYKIGFPFVWDSQNPDIIREQMTNILTAYIDSTIQNDYDALDHSTRYTHYKLYNNSPLSEQYLNDILIPIHLTRVFAQTRINLNTIRIKDEIYRTDTETNCLNCNVEDNIKHRITECLRFTSMRTHYFPSLTHSNLHIFLNNKNNVYKFYNLISEIFCKQSPRSLNV